MRVSVLCVCLFCVCECSCFISVCECVCDSLCPVVWCVLCLLICPFGCLCVIASVV